MKKAFFAIALAGLATLAGAVEYNWPDVQANVSQPLFKNRSAKDQDVVKKANAYLDTLEAVSDHQKLSVIGWRVMAYDQTAGSNITVAGLKAYADSLIAAAKFDKPMSGAAYVALFSLWWRSSDPQFANDVYTLMHATPGYEAFMDAGLWANAVGKHAEAYDLYMATKTWPQRAINLAFELNDPAKAVAAAKLITERVYSVQIVKEVVRLTVSRLVGNNSVAPADIKTLLQNINRKYSAQLVVDKAAWEPVIAQVRTVLETY